MARNKWTIDASHSAIEFKVKHMMISNVRGSFHKFDADVVADAADLTSANVSFTIDVDSINTRDEQRDGHLKSADFFDVEKYPQIAFKSTQVSRKGDGDYALSGDVTIHGVTKPVTFAVEFEGEGKDPWGNERAGFSANASLSRKDFGLVWNAALETGGVLVGDEVKISLQLEAIKQGEA
jgi:polyisoprenoid-binding protein YceI